MTDLHAVLATLRDRRHAGELVVPEPLGKSFLSASGIAVPQGVVIDQGDEVEQLAGAIEPPAVAKAVLSGERHKTELGGVTGPLRQQDAVVDAVREMWRTFGPPVLLERWHEPGVECFVGVTMRGPHGPVVSFGLGGIWVEVMRDVAHRSAPVDVAEATQMVDTLRAAPLLRGERGKPAVDVAALAETISTLSLLVTDTDVTDVVAEVEINPLLARAIGPPVALDCALTLSPSPSCEVHR